MLVATLPIRPQIFILDALQENINKTSQNKHHLLF
jgi:hypothetical protein